MRKFRMPEKSRADRWHEEAMREDPVLTFLVIVLVGLAFYAALIFVGTQPVEAEAREMETLEGRDLAYVPEPEPVISEEANDDVVDEGAVEVADAEAVVEEVQEEPQAYWDPMVTWEEAPAEVSTGDLRFNGVEYGDDGTKYTWYSQNVLPGGGLDIPGRHVDDQGYVCDGDGNIVVASSDLEYGSVVETPYGSAKVYDTGYLEAGQLDVYTAW